jgi:hypothetical protein
MLTTASPVSPKGDQQKSGLVGRLGELGLLRADPPWLAQFRVLTPQDQAQRPMLR